MTPAQLESHALDAAGFHLKGTGKVDLDCRVRALIMAHRYGLDLMAGHLGPIKAGRRQNAQGTWEDFFRTRITRDGLLHVLHRGTARNGFRDPFDGLTYDPLVWPRFNAEADDNRGEWLWCVELHLNTARHPVMFTGHYNAKRPKWEGKGENRRITGHESLPNAREMAFKAAEYGAYLRATDIAAWAPELAPRELLDRPVARHPAAAQALTPARVAELEEIGRRVRADDGSLDDLPFDPGSPEFSTASAGWVAHDAELAAASGDAGGDDDVDAAADEVPADDDAPPPSGEGGDLPF
jgi:hypothetical protein